MDEELASKAISFSRDLGAEYVDARMENHYSEQVGIYDGRVQRASSNLKEGIGIRMIVEGAWGFQSTSNLTYEGTREACNLAFRAAKESAKHVSRKVRLAESKAKRDRYSAKIKIKLQEIRLEDKISDLLVLSKHLKAGEEVKRTAIEYTGTHSKKLFTNSEGASIWFENSIAWVDLRADASGSDGTSQFFSETIGGGGGYEVLRDADLESNAMTVGARAVELLYAEPARNEMDVKVILESNYLALLSHEIVGHPSEADRVLGYESAWAGTAWWAGKIGQKIGSELMTVFDDPTVPGTFGFYLYDDEGVEARRKILVDRGVLSEHMHSRETAAILGTEPNAGMRALTFEYVPLIRMSNTFFAPGDWSYEEMIRETKHGYLVEAERQPSIDDRRFNWTISAHSARRIDKGELGERIRDIALTSTAPKFFDSIDAVSKNLKIHPVPGCGKGDPMQAICVGNGGPAIRGTADILGR
jgi:TldD protein